MLLSLVVHTYSLRYWFPAVVMLGTAPAYVLSWGACRVLTAVLPSRLYRRMDDHLYNIYQSLVLFFFENYTGVEIVIYGDVPKMKENVVYLSNHQCTADWIIADMLAIRQEALGHVRYVLKDGLKWLPLYGWYFSQHGGVYVKRSAKFDENAMKKKLSSQTVLGTPMYLVIFPEGTRYNPELKKMISDSQAFATKEEFLCKESPRVHIHFERVDMKEIPPESVIFRGWLHKRFEIKDQMLTTFYESEDPDKKGKFPGEGQRSHLSIMKTLPSLLFLGGLTLPMLLTESGRKLYVRTWVYGTLLGWLWVNVSP
ncbi:1-acyl-sn-glycerol-3-phosphate acyltransferase epsilon-like isoform X2 [Salvelinus fontinalis]|uniref:1-acyl-sn-glycerol-3-phosphate acyltransferase epsilon-like isoform X2 n=1 Tax=Salvelinus fontinalis TaxID=8038 RepID=UPI002484FF8C|nr:1-acyl-sn-glycerol-3-phosphate acyltransferase epsilon-like isoform X2 [Salvelinus fontinalis]